MSLPLVRQITIHRIWTTTIHTSWFSALLAGPAGIGVLIRKSLFYKKWNTSFLPWSCQPLFILCGDMWFTHRSVWSFNPDHITGMHVGNLPLEEVLFFLLCLIAAYSYMNAYVYLFSSGQRPLMPSGRKVLSYWLLSVSWQACCRLINTTQVYLSRC